MLTPIGPTRPTSVPTTVATIPTMIEVVALPTETLPQTGSENTDIVAGLGLALMLTGTCLLLAIRRPH